MRKQLEFIVNPISGTTKKEEILSLIDRILDPGKFVWNIVRTEYAGHAIQLAKDAAERGVDIVVAVGGDGTVNEIGRGLIHTQTALAIIPCGSGNGLARHLGIPVDPKSAIELLNTARIIPIDYGIINDMPFFCTCGVGFDAYVAFKFSSAGRRGILTYLENTLKEGLRYKPQDYEIEDEDSTHVMKAFLITCGNASQYGNNVYIAPEASISDGLLDVTIMKPFTLIDAPKVAYQLFNKTIGSNSHIFSFRTRKIVIHRKQEGVVHYDGDPMLTGADVEISIVKGGLYVAVPMEGEERYDQIEQPNLLKAFSEYFSKFEQVTQADSPKAMNKRFQVVNRVLLRKLKKL